MEILNILSIVSTILWVVDLLAFILSAIFGVAPLLWKLGLGRWTTKIALVSDDNNIKESVENDLRNSKLFRGKNIEKLSSKDIACIDGYSIIVVCDDVLGYLEEILARKNSGAGLVVYAQNAKLTPSQMKLLNSHPLVALVNFRGRLINDLLVMLMGTAYVKK